MRAFYDVEDQRNVYEDDLRAEFERLREMDPETYDYSFERYVENCTSKNGFLMRIDVNWFTYDTLWLVSEISNYLDERGIRYTTKPVDHLFRRFSILASDAQKCNLMRFIKSK
jgi:hypothetical protein